MDEENPTFVPAMSEDDDVEVPEEEGVVTPAEEEDHTAHDDGFTHEEEVISDKDEDEPYARDAEHAAAHSVPCPEGELRRDVRFEPYAMSESCIENLIEAAREDEVSHAHLSDVGLVLHTHAPAFAVEGTRTHTHAHTPTHAHAHTLKYAHAPAHTHVNAPTHADAYRHLPTSDAEEPPLLPTDDDESDTAAIAAMTISALHRSHKTVAPSDEELLSAAFHRNSSDEEEDSEEESDDGGDAYGVGSAYGDGEEQQPNPYLSGSDVDDEGPGVASTGSAEDSPPRRPLYRTHATHTHTQVLGSGDTGPPPRIGAPIAAPAPAPTPPPPRGADWGVRRVPVAKPDTSSNVAPPQRGWDAGPAVKPDASGAWNTVVRQKRLIALNKLTHCGGCGSRLPAGVPVYTLTPGGPAYCGPPCAVGK